MRALGLAMFLKVDRSMRNCLEPNGEEHRNTLLVAGKARLLGVRPAIFFAALAPDGSPFRPGERPGRLDNRARAMGRWTVTG